MAWKSRVHKLVFYAWAAGVAWLLLLVHAAILAGDAGALLGSAYALLVVLLLPTAYKSMLELTQATQDEDDEDQGGG